MYSVYHAKNEMPLIIYATSKECADAMGVTLKSFYRYIVRMKQRKKESFRRWLIYEDEVEDIEDE